MADDLHYVGGDNYFLDDFSGFKVRASKARVQWDNVATTGSKWSPKQPQDNVIGVRDDQTVALNRPRQPNQFTVVGTSVMAFAPKGSFSFQVDSTLGFVVGDTVQVMLDAGDPFIFTLGSVAGNELGWSGAPLPGSVGGSLGDPIENSVIDLSRVN